MTTTTQHLLEKIDPKRLPQHIAIIMDGNGRWAKLRRKPRLQGHFQGAEVVSAMARLCSDLGVKFLTLYAFSEENWSRPRTEISGLMQLLKIYLNRKLGELMTNDIRLATIGNLDKLPAKTRQLVEATMHRTANNRKMVLTLALSYSGRDEIVRATRKIIAAKTAATEVTQNLIARHLDTSNYPDPDLLIRTSGELRISNFMLWQLAYSEIVVTDTLWPDFSAKDLYEAIIEFQTRVRRFGGISGHRGTVPKGVLSHV